MGSYSVGIAGASGLAGSELLRLVLEHPDMELAVAGAERRAGAPIASVCRNLAPALGERPFAAGSPAELHGLDVVFLALPHGQAAHLVPAIRGHVGAVVDLSPDFRLRDPTLYPEWYGWEHPSPELLASAVTGLPELAGAREALRAASLVAVPGCYVTASTIALAPFVRSGAVEAGGIVVDAASGLSGAGREPSPETTFCAADEDYRAYGVTRHRHLPEMEALLGARLLFTPHLAPMSRGMLATCYARARDVPDSAAAVEVLAAAYAGRPFVHVSAELPSTRATVGSNAVHLSARVDGRSGWLVVLSALDNLVKGAAGQAIQCANLLLGLSEDRGLSRLGALS